VNSDSTLIAPTATLIGLCVALGIGLLVGAEREQSKDDDATPSVAGIRTFAVVALLGAMGFAAGGVLLLAVIVALVGAGALLAYQHTGDKNPGMTTEFALPLTCVLGGLAIQDALTAAGVGAVLALLLASRNRMHHFVQNVLSEQELHDIILFSAVALIALPLAPDAFMGPFSAINPHSVVLLIVIVMAISAAGYVAMRWLGTQYGLPLAGFASGFISSTATIYSMGQRAAASATSRTAAVAGAVLSSLATIIQMSLIIEVVQPALLVAMAVPMAMGGAVALVYGLIFLVRSAKGDDHPEFDKEGRAFDLKTSVGFAVLLSVVMVVSAGLNSVFGNAGMLIGAAVSGFADAHATAASAASLLAAGKIEAGQAIFPILVGLTTNTVTKAIVAFNSGGKAYALQVVPGLVAMMTAVWMGAWLIL
jgi:uncharacterized membrane protein (DUF4010 family)